MAVTVMGASASARREQTPDAVPGDNREHRHRAGLGHTRGDRRDLRRIAGVGRTALHVLRLGRLFRSRLGSGVSHRGDGCTDPARCRRSTNDGHELPDRALATSQSRASRRRYHSRRHETNRNRVQASLVELPGPSPDPRSAPTVGAPRVSTRSLGYAHVVTASIAAARYVVLPAQESGTRPIHNSVPESRRARDGCACTTPKTDLSHSRAFRVRRRPWRRRQSHATVCRTFRTPCIGTYAFRKERSNTCDSHCKAT
jgi:hypothetical protein